MQTVSQAPKQGKVAEPKSKEGSGKQLLRKTVSTAAVGFTAVAGAFAVGAILVSAPVALPIVTGARVALNLKRGQKAEVAKTLGDTALKTQGWASDFIALHKHVGRIGQHNVLGTAPLKTDLTPDAKGRTLYVNIPGFMDYSGSLDGINEKLMDATKGEHDKGSPIDEGDFYKVEREMLTVHSIEQYVAGIIKELQTVAQKRGHDDDNPMPVRLNTHSMGGLIAIEMAYQLAMLQKDNGGKGTPLKIDCMVLIGTPLEGAKAAHLGRGLVKPHHHKADGKKSMTSKCAQQMTPGSSFFTGKGDVPSFADKMAKVLDGGTQIGIIASKDDTMVPHTSATAGSYTGQGKPLDGKKNLKILHTTRGQGHIYLPNDSKNQKAAVEFLAKPQPKKAGESDPSANPSYQNLASDEESVNQARLQASSNQKI